MHCAARLATVLLAACVVPAARLSGEVVSWNIDANGSWTVASNWSTNSLPSTTSDVVINRPAGDFIVSLTTGTQNINSLQLSEQLTVAAGAALNIATTLQINNILTVDGTLRNATVTLGGGGQLNVVSATFDAVKLNQDLTVTNDTLSVLNGLTLNGGVFRLIENAGTAAMTITNTQTLAGTGTVLFDGVSATGPSLGGSFTLTLAPGITVKTGTGHGALASSGLINQGVISSETATKTVTISSPFFQNSGTLQTLNGGAINLTMATITAAQLGNFNASGGVFTISNTFDNTGNNLALSGGASALTLQGTLRGGTLSNAAGLTLNSPTFENVTLATNVSLTNDVLTTTGGLTFAGSTLTITESSTAGITLTNSQTYAGTGVILFDGTTSTGPGLGGNFTLTLAPGITFMTGSTHAALSPGGLINQGVIMHATAVRTLTLGSVNLTNSGTISVQNGGLVIAGNFTNNGLLSVTNGGTALISSNLTVAQLGTFDATLGTIRIAGILDNTGNNLALTGGANRLTIEGGIKGGAITNITGLTLSSVSFDGVNLGTNLTISADSLTLLNGLNLNNANLEMTETTGTTTLALGSSGSITGNGSILLTGTAAPTVGGAFTLTLGSGISVVASASATIGTTGLVNNGRISAEASSRTLTISSPTFINAGTLTATNGGYVLISGNLINTGVLQMLGGGMRINSTTTANLGNFDATGGTLLINTLLDNTGNTLTLTGGAKTLTVAGTLKGGVIADATGLTLSTAIFDGVTLGADLTVTDQSLSVLNGLMFINDAALHLNETNSAAANLTSNGSFSGTGEVVFDGPSANGPGVAGAFTLTVAPGMRIRTGTGNGAISVATLINNGLISSQSMGKTLTISSANFTNNGTLAASDGGVLVLTNPLLTIGGTFQANSGGMLRFLGGNLAITSPLLLTNGTASFGATATTVLGITGTGGVVVDATRAVTSDGVVGPNWTINGTHNLRFSATDSGASAPASLVIAKTGANYTGRLNLTNAKLVIDSTSAIDKANKITELYAAITSGAANGAWTGPGINSSTAAADAAHLAVQLYDNADSGRTLFGGLPVDASSILITVAPIADATLDGSVDAFDLNILAANWQRQAGATAATGDFTRDGIVDAFDLNALASNWQFNSGGGLSLEAALAAISFPVTAVPEPASLMLLAPVLWLQRRRRRR